jgi:preprotein translocase subunit SecE
MNAKVDSGSGLMDTIKMWVAVLLLCGGIGGFYYFEDQHDVIRVLGLLAVVGVALFVMAQAEFGQRILGFISGANTEVRKVVWPTRTETVQTTLAVLVLVLILGIFLWLLDMLLLASIQLMTGQGS